MQLSWNHQEEGNIIIPILTYKEKEMWGQLHIAKIPNP